MINEPSTFFLIKTYLKIIIIMYFLKERKKIQKSNFVMLLIS